jgi:hypothetical protein
VVRPDMTSGAGNISRDQRLIGQETDHERII